MTLLVARLMSTGVEVVVPLAVLDGEGVVVLIDPVVLDVDAGMYTGIEQSSPSNNGSHKHDPFKPRHLQQNTGK